MRQYTLNFNNELIVDNFAGGGGASIGIEAGLNRPIDIAINHDKIALEVHKLNHPHTLHIQSDVFEVDPIKVCDGRPVGLAWFSPDCKHFSKAKGGTPIEKQIGFGTSRKGTGTAEWAEVTENICIGCPNDCLYCYAAHNANRFGKRNRHEWAREEFTKRSEMKSYPARNGVIMFPSSHDITPFNITEYIRIARLILSKGNRLLIVTKPRLESIRTLLADLEPWKEQILFRFTIGTLHDSVSKFWEPCAPFPWERIESIKEAYCSGFKTSVSIEPMLAGRYGSSSVAYTVNPYVTDTIWIGKMNKALLRVDGMHKGMVLNVIEMQRDSEIIKLYHDLKHDDKIMWKDSIKSVLANNGIIQK